MCAQDVETQHEAEEKEFKVLLKEREKKIEELQYKIICMHNESMRRSEDIEGLEEENSINQVFAFHISF